MAIILKRCSQKRVTMYEVSWLPRQMSSVMTLTMEQFVIMRPYCAHVHILEWQTMFPKGVFIIFAQKVNFPFSQCRKRGFLYSNYQECVAKMRHLIFHKQQNTLCAIHQLVASQSFPSTYQQNDKFLLIQLEPVKI